MELLEAAFTGARRHSFWEVQNVVLQLILLFTFARSETPCPKNFTGEEGFNPDQHLQVKDVEVRPASGGLPAHLAVRLKTTKTDQRLERPEAAGNEDWILIGDLPGSQFSILDWVQRLFRLHGGARDPESPFFIDAMSAPALHAGAVRPLRYASAIAGARHLWARASSASEAARYGLHGLRVTGYDSARTGPQGEELAVAQGGWRSLAHRRYARFQLAQVLQLPQAILAAGAAREGGLPVEVQVAPRPAQHGAVPTPERHVARLRQRPAVAPAPVAAAPARPLTTGRAAVGRRVLVPVACWPDYACDEHGGEGWEAVITRCSRGVATVRFVHARDPDGHAYPVERLSVSQLTPL